MIESLLIRFFFGAAFQARHTCPSLAGRLACRDFFRAVAERRQGL